MLFKQIHQNKRNTWIILALFAILLLAVSGLIGSVFTSKVGIVFFLFGIGYVAYVYFDATAHLMKVTGAQRITKQNNPEIYEMVEELCIAGGIPVPKLYIVPVQEPNAFATGRDPEHASLALTQGLLNIMTKNEVQGVIGHELSHIRNYDTRITVIASGLVNLIYMTGITLLAFAWGVITDDSSGIVSLVIKILAVFVGFIGLIITVIAIPIAKLLFLMVSRQREYLADVGSADLTREPSGIISALQKLENIEAQESNEELAAKRSDDLMLNSLYFNLPSARHWWIRLFSDHPPLDKRIQRLKNTAKM